MIQYNYFHTDSRGFISRMSVSRDDARYSYYADLFGKIRMGVEINAAGGEKTTFTYATVGEDGVFMQANKGANTSLFVDALLFDARTLTVSPTRYIGKLTTDARGLDDSDEPLPAGQVKFPPIGYLGDSFSLASNLHHIYGKLIDVLLYGDPNRQVVIMTDTPQSAVNYIKVLGLLLPASYMRRIGFSVGVNAIPYEPWYVINENGQSVAANVKIWLPDTEHFDFDSYSSFYYIFDTKNNRDNITLPASPLNRAIEMVNLAHAEEANAFAHTIAPAFSENGTVDMMQLERLCAVYTFNRRRDAAAAKDMIRIAAGNEQLRGAFCDAAQILLADENASAMTAEEKSYILREYRGNPYVAQQIEAALFHYFALSYQSLQSDENALFESLLASDLSGDRLRQVYEEVPYADYEASKAVFDLTCRIFGACLAKGHPIHALSGMIGRAIEFFDIETCRRAISNDELLAGESTFDVAARANDPQLKTLALSVLMASAYFFNLDEESCNIRIRGLRRVLNASPMSNAQKLSCLVDIREMIRECSGHVTRIDYRFDFLGNTELGRTWLRELAGTLSVQEMLDVYRVVYGRTQHTILYESMISALLARLLDSRFVRQAVLPGTPLYRMYAEFFNTLPADTRAANREIDAYLNELNRGEEVSKQLNQSRAAFLMNCFDTLSPKDKNRISRDDLNALNVAEYSERIANVFMQTDAKSGNKMRQTFQKFFTVLNGVMWCAVAFLLMELVSRFLDFGLQEHISTIYNYHAFPIMITLCSGSLYVVNLNTNSALKRNLFTALETLILIVVAFGLFRLLLL